MQQRDSMNINDKVELVLSQQSKTVFTTKEIKDLCVSNYNINRNSVIPSDYCYNRTNNGTSNINKFLIYMGFSEYRYVGKSHDYNGLVYHRPKGTSHDQIVGEWSNGHFQEVSCSESEQVSNFSYSQIESLYESYLKLLFIELETLNCSPTQLTHLIGRIGEFKCALYTGGSLASETNQHGFDVISTDGRRISVKTTSQKSGFVSLNKNTLNNVDDLMVIQFENKNFRILYYGNINTAINSARRYENKYELDISKARNLGRNVA
ncbi:hypothetical protein Vca1114GL_00052 [Vibrio campbellii]|nr:hypothetical protein Vca1114GL_00052 [Vibrio campbellii]